jgi:hypothetical protein
MPDKRMRSTLKRYCLVLLLCFTAHLLFAQQLRYVFKNYTPSDGLPSSEVHKVLKDSKQYMWFATDHGVCRYNGYGFEVFNLPDNSILGLYEDYKKRIWAQSFSGQLFYFENGKFEAYKWNSKLVDAIKPGVINALHLDSSDALYVSSTGPNSYVISNDGIIRDLVSIRNKIQYNAFRTTPTKFFTYVSSYPGKFNTTVAQRFYFNTNIAIRFGKKEVSITIPYHYKPERFRVRQFSDERVLFFSDQIFIWIYANGNFELKKPGFRIYDVEEIDGLFYLATEKGLILQNRNEEVVAEYLAGKHITSIAKDHEGGLWVTSLLNGVFYLNSTRTKHLATNGAIVDRKINVLYNLGDTGILAGTNDGYVLRISPGSVWEEIKMNVKPIHAFYRHDASAFFVGGPMNAEASWFKKMKGESVSYIQVSCLSNMIVSDGVLYVGMNDNVSRITVKDSAVLREALTNNSAKYLIEYLQVAKESFRVSKILINHKKEFLIGNQFGLWKYVNRKLIRYDSTKTILQSRVTEIAEYKDQLLLVGTRGKGLLVLSKDTLIQLTEEEGLISNNIRKVFIDSNRIWLATNKGLSLLTVLSVNPFSCTIRNINVQDGLLSNEINDVVRSGEYMVVASNLGISYLDRNYFIRRNAGKLPFHVKDIRVNGRTVDSSSLLQLGFKKRNLSVTYEGLQFNDPGRISYRYRLMGYDTTWFYTNDLQVQFNPLPYGDYVLELQAKTEIDEWNNSSNLISLPIVCKTPFWSSVWFWVFVFSLTIFLLIMSFRRRIRSIRQREKEEKELQKRISESEQMALKAQMNPHFIFNSLNSIQHYVIDRDVEGANSFISGFSKLMRQTLEFSSKDTISLEEEISYLTTYLSLEKARMESQFLYEVQITTEENEAQLEIPPLLLQPYVENALRHGVRYLTDRNGFILLSFQQRGSLLICTIEDNGVGRSKAGELKAVNPIEYQSRGMSLTAERIALLNAGRLRKIEVTVEDLEDPSGKATGTRVQVIFPI